MDSPDSQLQELLSTLDPTTRTLVAEVDLGMQAKEFLSSDLGRHFVGCALQEVAEAQEKLAKVSPWRRHAVQDLQNRIWRANFLLSWLRELLITAKSAENALEEAETGD